MLDRGRCTIKVELQIKVSRVDAGVAAGVHFDRPQTHRSATAGGHARRRLRPQAALWGLRGRVVGLHRLFPLASMRGVWDPQLLYWFGFPVWTLLPRPNEEGFQPFYPDSSS